MRYFFSVCVYVFIIWGFQKKHYVHKGIQPITYVSLSSLIRGITKITEFTNYYFFRRVTLFKFILLKNFSVVFLNGKSFLIVNHS